MEISPIASLWLLLASFAFGMTLGVGKDLCQMLRLLLGGASSSERWERWCKKTIPILRRPLRPSRVPHRFSLSVFVQDVALFAVAAVGIVLLNYRFNYGRFRLFTLIALIVGFSIYSVTVGRLVLPILEGVAFVWRAAAAVVFVLISRPLVLFVKFFGKIARKIKGNLRNTIEKKQKQVYNKRRKTEILRQAEQGFLQNLV